MREPRWWSGAGRRKGWWLWRSSPTCNWSGGAIAGFGCQEVTTWVRRLWGRRIASTELPPLLMHPSPRLLLLLHHPPTAQRFPGCDEARNLQRRHGMVPLASADACDDAYPCWFLPPTLHTKQQFHILPKPKPKPISLKPVPHSPLKSRLQLLQTSSLTSLTPHVEHSTHITHTKNIASSSLDSQRLHSSHISFPNMIALDVCFCFWSDYK